MRDRQRISLETDLWVWVEVVRETDIQRDILDAYLMHPKVGWAMTTHTGLFKKRHGGLITIGFDGLSDIIGMQIGGRVFCFEVKKPKEKPTNEQLEFIAKVNNHGGTAGWGSTVEQALEILDKPMGDWS